MTVQYNSGDMTRQFFYSIFYFNKNKPHCCACFDPLWCEAANVWSQAHRMSLWHHPHSFNDYRESGVYVRWVFFFFGISQPVLILRLAALILTVYSIPLTNDSLSLGWMQVVVNTGCLQCCRTFFDQCMCVTVRGCSQCTGVCCCV